MRLYLDGVQVDLDVSAPTTRVGDRVLVRTPEGTFSGVAVIKGNAYHVSFRGRTFRLDRAAPAAAADFRHESGRIVAPMPGLIVEVTATPGAEFHRGAKLAVLEAMKTQMPLAMPFDGVVESIHVRQGQQVEQDSLVAVVAPVPHSPQNDLA